MVFFTEVCDESRNMKHGHLAASAHRVDVVELSRELQVLAVRLQLRDVVCVHLVLNITLTAHVDLKIRGCCKIGFVSSQISFCWFMVIFWCHAFCSLSGRNLRPNNPRADRKSGVLTSSVSQVAESATSEALHTRMREEVRALFGLVLRL